MNESKYFLTVSELKTHFRRHGINCRKDSRELIRDIGDAFRCEVPLRTLVLAALLAGYAVVPHKADTGTFTFCCVSE